MKEIHGDLIALALQGEFDVIVHGCNCMHTMGAGIAKQVRNAFPVAYEADLATPKGDLAKLGTISVANAGGLTIINAYTQFRYGRGVQVEYGAIRSCFGKIAAISHSTLRIGYPRLGAGLAGGDWAAIARIIEYELEGCDHTLVYK